MKNDPETADAAPQKKSSLGAVLTGIVAGLLGLSVLAVYVLYVALSLRGPFDKGMMMRLALQLLCVVSILAGVVALLRRRWIGALLGIVCPVLLPLFDLVVRTLRGGPVS